MTLSMIVITKRVDVHNNATCVQLHLTLYDSEHDVIDLVQMIVRRMDTANLQIG